MQGATESVTESADRHSARNAWVLTGVLWVAFCLNFADRQVVFSIFPVLRSELGFTDTQLGLTGSLFLWVYALCSPVAGRIGDRFSKRLLICISLVLWSAATLGTAFVNSPLPLLAGRASIGVTEALFYPAAVAMVANAHSLGTRSRALAVFNSASVVGVMVGGSLGGYAAEYYNWRLGFILLGATGLVYAAPLGYWLRGSAEEKTEERQSTGSFSSLFTRPTLIALAAIYASNAFATYLLYTWFAAFLAEKFSLGLAEAGVTSTLYAKSAAWAGLAVGGWLADWLFRRHSSARFWVLSASTLLLGPAMVLIALSTDLTWTKIGAVGFGLCNGIYQANLFAAAFEVVEPNQRGSAVGILNLVGAATSGFAGVLGGMLRDSVGLGAVIGWSALPCLAAAFALASMLPARVMRDKSHADKSFHDLQV